MQSVGQIPSMRAEGQSPQSSIDPHKDPTDVGARARPCRMLKGPAEGSPATRIDSDGSQSECGLDKTRVVQGVGRPSVVLRLHLGAAARIAQP